MVVSKTNGMVAFGHAVFRRSALSSLSRGLSSLSPSSTDADIDDRCLLLDKCSIVDDDSDSTASRKIVVLPGNQSQECFQGYYCHNDTEKCWTLMASVT